MILWYGCAPSPRGQTPSQIIAFGEVPAVSFLGRRRRVAVSGPCLHDRPRQSSPRAVRADPGGQPAAGGAGAQARRPLPRGGALAVGGRRVVGDAPPPGGARGGPRGPGPPRTPA